jgi:hypothetical protein
MARTSPAKSRYQRASHQASTFARVTRHEAAPRESSRRSRCARATSSAIWSSPGANCCRAPESATALTPSRMPALIGPAMFESTKRNAVTRIHSVSTLGRITPSPRMKNRPAPPRLPDALPCPCDAACCMSRV